MSDDRLARLQAVRDATNDRFLSLASIENPHNTTVELTANLALIGGRLDKIIRDQIVADRKARRP